MKNRGKNKSVVFIILFSIFIVHWPILMLRLCCQLSKNTVHVNSHKDAVQCSRLLPSSLFQGSLARLVSTRTQVRIFFLLFIFFIFLANDGAGDVNPTSDDFFLINIK